VGHAEWDDEFRAVSGVEEWTWKWRVDGGNVRGILRFVTVCGCERAGARWAGLCFVLVWYIEVGCQDYKR
jgi:hypothetical protein